MAESLQYVDEPDLPTEVKPFYKLIDADELGALEDLVTEFAKAHREDDWFFLGPPQLVGGDDEEPYWVQAVFVDG